MVIESDVSATMTQLKCMNKPYHKVVSWAHVLACHLCSGKTRLSLGTHPNPAFLCSLDHWNVVYIRSLTWVRNTLRDQFITVCVVMSRVKL